MRAQVLKSLWKLLSCFYFRVFFFLEYLQENFELTLQIIFIELYIDVKKSYYDSLQLANLQMLNLGNNSTN
jgi:hypothetical protein